jgi:uncharacterized protein
MQKSTSILYFDKEGRENLPQVLRIVKRTLTKRPELRKLKLIIFTATGEGPALACAQLHEFAPKIIAVTFPPNFSVTRGAETQFPHVTERLRSFFNGVGVSVITARLPFDPISKADAHNTEMQLVKEVLTIFAGGFSLCIQAVLSACDHGEVAVGEMVLSLTGDVAALVTASSSEKFLSKTEALVVNEILCKPRNLTISKKLTTVSNAPSHKVLSADGPSEKVLGMVLSPLIKPPTKDEV